MAEGGAYLVEGSMIWVEGVAPVVWACGMWKEEVGAGVDYLPR